LDCAPARELIARRPMISARADRLTWMDHETPLDEKTLVDKARGGDDGAFGELAAAYGLPPGMS